MLDLLVCNELTDIDMKSMLEWREMTFEAAKGRVTVLNARTIRADF